MPITADFLESGYFIFTLISDNTFPIVFSIITNIWILIFILIFYINLKLGFFKVRVFRKINIYKKLRLDQLNTKNMTPLKFLLGFIIFIFLLKNILDWTFYYSTSKSFLRHLSFAELRFDFCSITNKLNNLNIFQSTLCYIKKWFLEYNKICIISVSTKNQRVNFSFFYNWYYFLHSFVYQFVF